MKASWGLTLTPWQVSLQVSVLWWPTPDQPLSGLLDTLLVSSYSMWLGSWWGNLEIAIWELRRGYCSSRCNLSISLVIFLPALPSIWICLVCPGLVTKPSLIMVSHLHLVVWGSHPNTSFFGLTQLMLMSRISPTLWSELHSLIMACCCQAQTWVYH